MILFQAMLHSLKKPAPLCSSWHMYVWLLEATCMFGFSSWFISSLPLIYPSQDKTFNKTFSEQNVEAEVLPQDSGQAQNKLCFSRDPLN